jgi:predicted ArsR family transcriptional regulator
MPHPSARSSTAFALPPWIRRALGDARTALVGALRDEPRTVEQLARTLKLSPNAIRSHLALLEQDMLVERLTLRRPGPGKPAFAYRLTTGAAIALSSAYAPAAFHLLGALNERLIPHEVVALLRSAGRAFGARHRSGAMRLRARIDDAADALTLLGGRGTVSEHADAFVVESEHCPLSALTASSASACHLLEAFVAESAGIPARQHCDRGAHPHCRFEIARERADSDASGHIDE